MKILTLDIETAPHVSHTWGLWDQTVGLPQLIEPGYILCIAAKWYGKDKIYSFSSKDKGGQKAMLEGIHRLMDEADVIVGYNSKKFDIPWIQGQFLIHGMKPPSPFKQVDLLDTAKRKFKLASNKLEYIATVLNLPRKLQTGGHQLWKDCMAGKKEALKLMREYNEHDVALTEMVYDRFMPYITSHPNHGTYNESGVHVCPNCGSAKVQQRGYARTMVNKYVRYQCTSCGKWSKAGQTEFNKDDREKILRDALN